MWAAQSRASMCAGWTGAAQGVQARKPLARVGRGPPAQETLHIRPGPRYLVPGQASPSLVSIGDPGGAQAANRPEEGSLMPDTQIWLEKGSDIPAGRRGGSAHRLYKT